MNTCILIGRLCANPELSYTPNTQTACCRFTLAVDRPRRNGEDQGADFIRIVVWGAQGENCDRYLSKGRQAAVHGRIQTGSYKGRNGNTVYTTDVIADRVEFLGGAGGENSRSEGRNQQSGTSYQQSDNALQNGNKQLGFNDLPTGFAEANDNIPF